MKFNGKKLLVTSQIVVILAFFVGMMLNYYTLQPLIDAGEEARLTKDISAFCKRFCPEEGCDLHNTAQMDSLMDFDPYVHGDFFIMDSQARIIYSRDGEKGSGYDVLSSKYGRVAEDLLRLEHQNPGLSSRMDYRFSTSLSMYADYQTDKGLIFFYVVDYRITGEKVLLKFYILLVYMLVGGAVVILISYIISRSIFVHASKEAQTQQELSAASAIQKSMLPRGERKLIQLDLNARLLPAKKVGGDFYCYLLRGGLLYFCIGDVSGKGIPASLFMSKAVTLFRSLASSELPVARMAEKMNTELCYNNEQHMFMTGILGTIRPYDGYVTYVNAGHELPVVWDGNPASGLDFLKSRGNIPFGVMEDVDFVVETYTMDKGGLLLLYTDGISEARSKNAGLLGRKKILSFLDEVKSLPSKEINDRLLNFVAGFESGIHQSDDITLLTFRNISNPKTLVIKNDIGELGGIVPFIQSIFMECRMDPKDHILVRSGLDEALTNCVLYAYDTPGNEITVSAFMEDKQLCFTITDSGRPFNPLEYSPAPSNGELKIGGLGISIYKANFDAVEYERRDNSNILKLIKQL